MKINDFLSSDITDFKALSLSELKVELKPVFAAANRRLTNLEKRGLTVRSPAYQAAMKTGKTTGRFDVTKSSKISLINEAKRVKSFLAAKTSTVTGANKEQEKARKRVEKYAKEAGFGEKELSESGWDVFWKTYTRFKNSNVTTLYRVGSTVIQAVLNNIIYNSGRERKSVDAALKKLVTTLDEYENDRVAYNSESPSSKYHLG